LFCSVNEIREICSLPDGKTFTKMEDTFFCRHVSVEYTFFSAGCLPKRRVGPNQATGRADTEMASGRTDRTSA